MSDARVALDRRLGIAKRLPDEQCTGQSCQRHLYRRRGFAGCSHGKFLFENSKSRINLRAGIERWETLCHAFNGRMLPPMVSPLETGDGVRSQSRLLVLPARTGGRVLLVVGMGGSFPKIASLAKPASRCRRPQSTCGRVVWGLSFRRSMAFANELLFRVERDLFSLDKPVQIYIYHY